MKKILVSFVIFLVATTIHAASIGSWKAYLAYANITEIEQAGNELFVLASKNLYLYNTQDHSVRTFSKMDALSDCSIAHIAWNKKAQRLIVVYENKNIDLLEPNGNCTNMPEYYMKSVTGDKSVNDIYVHDQFVYLSTGFGILKINVSKAEISDTYQLGFKVNYCYIENGKIYAASETNGLYAADLNSNLLDKSSWKYIGDYQHRQKTLDPELLETVKKANPGGPFSSFIRALTFKNGKLYATNGFDDIYDPGIIQMMKNDEWTLFEGNEVISKATGRTYAAIACVDIDPNDENHVFAASHSGIYEFQDGKFVNFYNDKNSPIEMASAEAYDTIVQYRGYQLIETIKFDREGNLWCLISEAPTQSILKRDVQGNWTSHHKNALVNEFTVKKDNLLHYKSLYKLKKLIIDSQDRLWFVNEHYRKPSFYCYNPATDEIHSYTKITNQDGTSYTIDLVRCVTEDKEGNIWVGTNLGTFYLEPSEFGSSDPVLIQVKVPRNDGTNYADYLLNGVDISCIKMDAAGRKWFGTYGNGVYLISADNIVQIHHFTANNSELLSDYINDIAINDKTGEVFFATQEGLCSFMSDATEAYETMDKDNVYAYPNPVKPDFTGLITIVGLSDNADVKIVTANGALVAEGRSNGGSFTWNGRDQNTGQRVASGVYMVMCSTKEGKKGTICKIAVIN